MWSRVDEAQHADVVAQYAHGVYPVEGRTTLRQETAAVSRATGVYRWGLPGDQPVPAETDSARFGPPPAGLPPAGRAAWLRRHVWTFSYEAMQPPGFYLAAVPAWAAGDAAGGPFSAVYGVRLLNAVLLAALVPIALATARGVPDFAGAAAAAAGFLAVLLPGPLLNLTQATNDALAAVAGGSATALAVSATRGAGWPVCLLLGGAAGVGLVAKASMVGLAPALLLGLVAGGAGLARVAAAGAVAVAPAAAWAAVNLRVYGHPIPSRQAAALLAPSIPPTPVDRRFIATSARHLFETFFGGEPYGAVPLGRALAIVAGVLTLAAIVGLTRRLRQRLAGAPLAVLATAVGGCLAWAYAAILLAGFGEFPPGRYLYPALIPALLLLSGGLFALAGHRLLWGGAAVLAVLGLASTAGYVLGFRDQPVPRSASPPAAARGGSVDLEGAYSSVRIRVTDLRRGPDPGSVWLLVSADNQGTTTAEWPGVPAITMPDGKIPLGEYVGRDHLPERLPPGGRASGWVELGSVPPAARTIVFGDVTTDGYLSMGSVEMAMP